MIDHFIQLKSMTLKMETCSSTYQIYVEIGLGLNSKRDKAKPLPLYWISKMGWVDFDHPCLGKKWGFVHF